MKQEFLKLRAEFIRKVAVILNFGSLECEEGYFLFKYKSASEKQEIVQRKSLDELVDEVYLKRPL